MLENWKWIYVLILCKINPVVMKKNVKYFQIYSRDRSLTIRKFYRKTMVCTRLAETKFSNKSRLKLLRSISSPHLNTTSKTSYSGPYITPLITVSSK